MNKCLTPAPSLPALGYAKDVEGVPDTGRMPELLGEYLASVPHKDFGMILARENRATARVGRRKK